MAESKISIFDVVLLLVGIGVAILGFNLIKHAYETESTQEGWLMIISIFSWLTLIVLFIMLSLIVDTSKKELDEIKTMIYMLSKNKKNK